MPTADEIRKLYEQRKAEDWLMARWFNTRQGMSEEDLDRMDEVILGFRRELDGE